MASQGTCPLCGERNDCAPARSGSLDTPCWCTEVVVDPSALARLPAEERNKSCLCRACATAAAPRGSAP